MSVYRNDGFILKRLADAPVVFYTLKRSRLRDSPVSFGDSPFQFTSGSQTGRGRLESLGNTQEKKQPQPGREVAMATWSRGLCAASPRNPRERQDPEGRAGWCPSRGWVLGFLAISPSKEFCVPSKLLQNWQSHHTYRNDAD